MTTETLLTLNNEIESFLKERGALKVGFATLETLAGGPPSADITYILPEARSAISYALLFDREKIRDYLSKKNFEEHEKNRFYLNYRSVKISKELADWLKKRGYNSKAVISNNNYRKEIRGWQFTMPPTLSHRYMAVRSGVGSYGWSGNVGIKGYGTTILLGTVVTAAELEPTDPLPPEESFCTNCKTCVSVCSAGLFERDKETSVTLGEKTFSHSARNSIIRCQYVCGGFTGLNSSGKWSTWSPGRFKIPKEDGEIMKMMSKAIRRFSKWPDRIDCDGGYENDAAPGLNIRLTCGMCQNICWGNPKETSENYRLLTNSGCIIQRENGDIEVYSPEEAEEVFEAMAPKHKDLYRLKN